MTNDNFGNLHNFSNWQQEDQAAADLTWRQRKFLQNRRLQMLYHQRHLKWISTSAIVWSHKEDGRHQYLQTVEFIHILIGITQLQSIFDILEIFVCAPTFSGGGKWATWAGWSLDTKTDAEMISQIRRHQSRLHTRPGPGVRQCLEWRDQFGESSCWRIHTVRI